MASISSFKADQVQKTSPTVQKLSGYIKFGIVVFAGYMAINYVPAFFDTAQFSNIVNHDRSASRLKSQQSADRVSKTFFKVTTLRQAYLRAGQTVQAQYYLPQGAQLDLEITQCKRTPVIEVFSCTPIKRETVRVAGNQNGTRQFMMDTPGFYKFSHVVTGADGEYQNVFWKRS